MSGEPARFITAPHLLQGLRGAFGGNRADAMKGDERSGREGQERETYPRQWKRMAFQSVALSPYMPMSRNTIRRMEMMHALQVYIAGSAGAR
jgi:hypothetical protein